jgi:hypothetical protein
MLALLCEDEIENRTYKLAKVFLIFLTVAI